MTTSVDDQIAEAAAADVSGWDFSWLDGRATEQRPSWGYQRLLGERLHALAGRHDTATLDIQTGGGEVFAGAISAGRESAGTASAGTASARPVLASTPAAMAATESWPPNFALATARLRPLGVVVVADPDEPPLPFANATFDLVSSRHPASVHWDQIARVLRPGGTYFAQHIGPDSNRELYEFFLGPQPSDTTGRHPDAEARAAKAAGLDVVQQRLERLEVSFADVGAVVYFLRKVIWTVPGFTVDGYRDELLAMHERIERDGAFACHSTRVLVEAVRPTG